MTRATTDSSCEQCRSASIEAEPIANEVPATLLLKRMGQYSAGRLHGRISSRAYATKVKRVRVALVANFRVGVHLIGSPSSSGPNSTCRSGQRCDSGGAV